MLSYLSRGLLYHKNIKIKWSSGAMVAVVVLSLSSLLVIDGLLTPTQSDK
jgi:hypothetical protein